MMTPGDYFAAAAIVAGILFAYFYLNKRFSNLREDCIPVTIFAVVWSLVIAIGSLLVDYFFAA